MKPLPKPKADHLLVLGSLTVLFVVGVLLAQRPRAIGHDPENARQGSSQYSTPLGGKAYFTLLERLGAKPVRLSRATELLPEGTKALLLLTPSETLRPEEVEGLRDWVTRGGTLIACPRRGAGPVDPLFSGFGLDLIEIPEPQPVDVPASLKPLDPRDPRPYTLSVRGGLRIRTRETEKLVATLARDARGALAVVVPRGEGRFVALSDPDLFSNAGISRADNVEFMVRLAERSADGGGIVFDEFHHGFKDGQSAFSVLWGSSFRPVMILAAIATFCGVIATGRRLGPPLTDHWERRRRPSEFIDAFAALCRKRRAGAQALSLLLSEFRLHLQQSYGASTPEALERVAARAGLDPGAPAKLLARASALAKSTVVDDAALVDCSRELERLRDSLRTGSLRNTS